MSFGATEFLKCCLSEVQDIDLLPRQLLDFHLPWQT